MTDKRIRRSFISVFLCLLMLLCMVCTACKKDEAEEEEASGYRIYYLNNEQTAITSAPFETESADDDMIMLDMLGALQNPPEDAEYGRVIPTDTHLENYTLNNGQLYLYFDAGYTNMTRVREILCRGAIVRSMCQFPQVTYVAFFVNGQALTDSNSNPIGLLTAESFIDNEGDSINSYSTIILNLYFANEEGDKLLVESDEFRFSSNMSLEKLVIEQLIKGPVSDHTYPCIPSNTQLLSVTTKSGICYVNFDSGFLSEGYDVLEAIPVYSIVNTLCELSTVNKVQIMVNGETQKIYKESVSIETPIERNLGIVEQ